MMNIFDKAIVELKTRGRAIGDLMNSRGEVCLIGACALGAGYSEHTLKNDIDAYEDKRFIPTLMKVIAEDFGYKNVTTPYQFNDGHLSIEPPSDDEVFAVLEKASVREQEKI